MSVRPNLQEPSSMRSSRGGRSCDREREPRRSASSARDTRRGDELAGICRALRASHTRGSMSRTPRIRRASSRASVSFRRTPAVMDRHGDAAAPLAGHVRRAPRADIPPRPGTSSIWWSSEAVQPVWPRPSTGASEGLRHRLPRRSDDRWPSRSELANRDYAGFPNGISGGISAAEPPFKRCDSAHS